MCGQIKLSDAHISTNYFRDSTQQLKLKRFIVPLSRTQSSMSQRGEGSFELFLQEVWEGSRQREADHALNSDEAVKLEETKGGYRKKLFDAIEEGDPYEVWKLLRSGEFENIPHLKDLNEVSKSIADTEQKKDCLCKFICSELKNICKNFCKNLCKNNGEEDLPSEEDRLNLEIQSNPLFLSLEWLWRNNPQSPQHEESEKGKESKLKDVIGVALDDAFLLEKMASYENPFSHDKYMDRAKGCEKFAIDIVEQVNGNKELLHKVMDIDGEGALVNKKSNNFICSLSLLKMAVDKERKMVSGRLISLTNEGGNKVIWYYQLSR